MQCIVMGWGTYNVINRDFNCVYYSHACSIEDPDNQRVVITGGQYTNTTVSVYGLQGWVEDLQPLNIGRYQHACTSYASGRSSRVRS